MNDLYSWIRDHLQALAASQVLPQPFEYEFVINLSLIHI